MIAIGNNVKYVGLVEMKGRVVFIEADVRDAMLVAVLQKLLDAPIHPDLSKDDMLEIYSIYELAKEARGIIVRPSYHLPHHPTFAVLPIGKAIFPKAGEISLAYNGVLFNQTMKGHKHGQT